MLQEWSYKRPKSKNVKEKKKRQECHSDPFVSHLHKGPTFKPALPVAIIALRRGGTDRTARPRVAFRIRAALKLDFIRRVVQGAGLLRGEDGVPGEDLVLVLDVVGVAVRHEHVVAAVGLCAGEGVAVLVVLEAPGDCVVVAAACVGRALRWEG